MTGVPVPTASTNTITFATSHGATVVGVGNGDPSCLEPDRGHVRTAFNGLVRAVVQAQLPRDDQGTRMQL